MNPPNPPDLLTYPEAVQYARLSESTIRRIVDEGGLKPVKIRRRVFFTKESLDALRHPREGRS